MITRRDFVRSGLIAAGTAPVIPTILARSVFAATAEGVHNDRVLVIVQLAGGNDGLNTVVPYADPAYHRARSALALDPTKVLQLDPSTALHPSLTNLERLYGAGQLAIVQGVGYPQPSYSHFESMYVWSHADPARQRSDGWLGTLLQSQLDQSGHPLTACALHETSTPAELSASSATVTVVDSIASYRLQGDAAERSAAPALYRQTPGAYGALFDTALATAQSGISQLQQTQQTYRPAVTYPTDATAAEISAALQLAASLVVTQPSTKLCHVLLGGFDTHQDELARQAALLTALDASLSAFLADLEAHGQAQRVLTATWSEFGRRIAENGSGGTDHGAAAPMFLLGPAVQGGLHGEAPSLTSTVDGGNLKYTVDFRSVYQTLIRDWLQADPSSVLGGTFPNLQLLKV